MRAALSHPMLSLAQAYALLSHQCSRAAIAPSLQLRGRPVPWVLGFAETHLVIAEPWSHHAALHRRKRGFSAMVQRWEALQSLVENEVGPRSLRLELWQDDTGLPSAEARVSKVGKQLGRPIQCFDLSRIQEALALVRQQSNAQHLSHENPLLATFGWTNTIAAPER